MIEIRIHGRGGQGSVTLAELLAEAGFYGGKEVQAFPNFGVERRGAPVTAYVRLSDKFINLRSQVYSPDYAIIQDVSLLSDEKVLADLKKGATVIINTAQELDKYKLPAGIKILTINASGLAMEVIGKPIINTIMLGAFAGATGLIKMSAIEKAIKARFSGELADSNVKAAQRGYEVINNN
jgi:pyruvate ferredoxin oxidoreductase gamma subunit